MEKRLVLAILLSMAVIMIFSLRNAERIREDQRHRQLGRTPTPIADTVTDSTGAQLRVPAAAESTPSQEPRSPERVWDTLAQAKDQAQEAICVIESDLWRVEISNFGAVPISWRLLKYQELFPDSRYLALRANRPIPQSLIARLDVPPVARLENPERLQDFLEFADYHLDWQELSFYDDLEPVLEAPNSWDAAARLRCTEELVVGDQLFPASPLLCRWGSDCWDTSILYEGPVGHLWVIDEPREVTFTAEGEGLRVSKIFTFHPDTYSVDFRLRVENIGEGEIDGECQLTWLGGVTRPSTQKQMLNSAHVATRDGDVESVPKMPGQTTAYVGIAKAALKAGERPTKTGEIETIWDQPRGRVRWVGIDSKYFLAAMIPQSPAETQKARMGLSRIPGEPVEHVRPAVGIDLPVERLEPRKVQEYAFVLYVGPKDGPALRAVDEAAVPPILEGGLEDLVENYWLSSIVSPIARLLLRLLKFFYGIIPNYGVGIVLLTLLVRLLMYPLYHKQMASMKKMQALQPQISKLKEQYKDKPQELQKKTMEFYREHKVNPMAGCLTMLPMMPIFIALWGTFNQAIELRGAPFVAWIQDLSQPDQAFFIPIAGYIIPINVLPLIYCALMLWSQSRQKIDMPNAGVMKIMPLFFVFIFWSIASGVILYFVISMTMDTVQRMLMDSFGRQKGTVKAPAVSMPARLGGEAGKTSKKVKAPAASTPARPRKAVSRSQSRRKR